jgi:protein TonB
MFNNLIESSSHAKEFKRRGSILLFTTATYLVLFAITGVVSIYAYDAHLETQSTELEITFVPIVPTEAPPKVARNEPRSASNTDTTATRPMRTEAVDSAANPTNIPDTIGTVRSPTLPWVRGAVIGPRDVDLPAPPGRGTPSGTGNTPVVDIPDAPPPPPADPPRVVPKTIKVSEGVLKGGALSLPRPKYTPLAIQARAQGPVAVQILIDEEGKVISAKAISGHPMLILEAQKAAMQARFTPTKLSNQPVKVSGVITYNFVLP